MDRPRQRLEEITLYHCRKKGRYFLHRRSNRDHLLQICQDSFASSIKRQQNTRCSPTHQSRRCATGYVYDFLLHTMTSKSTLSIFFLIALLSLQPAEATSYYFNHSATFFRPQQETDDEKAEEWYMVLIYSLLFGFFISFFGAVVGYFSLLEDDLFKRYRREGDIVYAQVVSYEFTRRGADVKCCDVHALTSMASQKVANTEQHRSNFEYVVVVEYERKGLDPHKSRIRKRVKAQEGDFIEKDQHQDVEEYAEYSRMSPATERSPNGSQHHQSLPSHKPLPRHPKPSPSVSSSQKKNPELSDNNRPLLHGAPETILVTGSRDGLDWITPRPSSSSAAAAVVDVSMMDSCSKLRNSISHQIENMEDLSMVRRPNFELLELYVLADYPKSGLPRRFVDRACSLRYRLSTLGLMVFDLALVAFCIKLAANAVLDLPDHHQRMIGWYAMFSFLILLALEVPLIHWLLRSWLESALREEYLEHADFAPWEQIDEDSSLSSAESDAYLYLSR